MTTSLEGSASPPRMSGEELAISSEVVVVVPTFNEEQNIVACLRSLLASGNDQSPIIVADGGSTDDTHRLVREVASFQSRVHLVHNEGRTQARALNMVARSLPPCCKWMVRADAHSIYPPNYVDTLLTTFHQTKASSVVVSMRAIGTSCFERAVAYSQNSLLGNGGSRHRRQRHAGMFVEHGHHAFFNLDAFRAVGGYDENFRFNEDFDLDYRILAAGGRLWLSEKVVVDYIPRSSLSSLARQYFNHGSGRARSVFKHRLLPKPRQMMPVAIFWCYVFATCLWPLTLIAMIPALCHISLCAIWGALQSINTKDRCAMLMGPTAVTMHVAWGAGFSCEIFKLALGSPFPAGYPERDKTQPEWLSRAASISER